MYKKGSCIQVILISPAPPQKKPLEMSNLHETPIESNLRPEEILVNLHLLFLSTVSYAWLALDRGRYIFVKYLHCSLLIIETFIILWGFVFVKKLLSHK